MGKKIVAKRKPLPKEVVEVEKVVEKKVPMKDPGAITKKRVISIIDKEIKACRKSADGDVVLDAVDVLEGLKAKFK